MDREEATFYIKELQKTYASMDKKVVEAVDMAIEALSTDTVSREFYEATIKVNHGLAKENIELKEQIESAEPTVIRSKTLMPTKDFKEWAKRVREENPNAIIIPCDAEVVSADRPSGEWIYKTNDESVCEEWECSECGNWNFVDTDYCQNCGAKMRNNK